MSTPTVLTAAQAIAEFKAGTLPAHVEIQDTASHVANGLDGLEQIALAGNLAGVEITNGTARLILTAARLSSDALVLSKITGGYHLEVKDTAANITAALARLESAAKAGTLAEIVLTDSGTPLLALGARQVSLYADALDKIASHGCVSVHDTAANVAKYLDGLQRIAQAGKLAAIDFKGAGNHLTLNASQVAADATALSKIEGKYLLNVADTAAAVATHLGTLEAAAKAGTLLQIALTDAGTPALQLTEMQLKSDGDALAKIAGSYTLSITHVRAADAAGIAANAHVTGIVVVDSAAHVRAHLGQLEALATSNGHGTSALNAVQPDAINNHGLLSAIDFTDSGTATLTLTTGQLTADDAALSLISSPFALNVTDVLAADAQGLSSNPLIASVAVLDTAANAAAALSSLEAADDAGKLASVEISNGIWTTRDESADAVGVYEKLSGGSSLVLDLRTASQDGTLPITASFFTPALDDVLKHGGFDVPVTVILPEFANDVFDGFTFSDVFDLQTALDNDTIQAIEYPFNAEVNGSFTTNPHFGSVGNFTTADLLSITNPTIINGWFATPAVGSTAFTSLYFDYTSQPITTDQAVGYYSSYLSHAIEAAPPAVLYTNGSVSDPTDESAVIENITDTSADLNADLASLTAALAGRPLPLPIILTDDVPATIAVAASQATNDSVVLNAVTSTYLLGISGNAGSFNTVDLSPLTTEKIELTFTNVTHNVTIDSGNIYDVNLAMLAAGSVSVEAVSGGTEIDYGGHQIVVDGTAPGAITVYTPVDSASSLGAHGAEVTGGVSVAAALAASGPVAITDTAAHVAASLDALEAISGQITGIGFSNSGAPMFTIDEPQLTADQDVLALLSGNYTLDVIDVAADDALSIAMQHDVSEISVSDSAVNILADLDSLEHIAKAGKLAAIDITSGVISFIDAPHLFADADVFRLLANNPDNIFT